jgi:ribosomal protein S15P/S13E
LRRVEVTFSDDNNCSLAQNEEWLSDVSQDSADQKQRQIDVLAARIQQLSAHVEVIEPATRVAGTEPQVKP